MTVLAELDGLQADIEAILSDVLSSVLDEEVFPAEGEPLTGELALSRLAIHDLNLDAYVEVEVTVPLALARMVAARMLAVGAPSSEDIVDAVAELGNIAGGNVKAVLFEHSRLSLPSPRFDTTGAGPTRHPDGLEATATVAGHLARLTVYPVDAVDGLAWPPYDTDVLESAQ